MLAILTLFDSEALLNFQLSPNGTVLFYLGLFGTVFAVSRGMIPDEHLVFEPEALLRQVVEHTHYFPDEWHGKLHTDEVGHQIGGFIVFNSHLDRCVHSSVKCLITKSLYSPKSY